MTEVRNRRWRLIRSGFQSPARNMAIDEALAESCGRGEAPPTLRFYGWSPPAVSIGYFQSMREEVDVEACRATGVGFVRRPTGGRAVLHEHELTYSVCLRETDLPGDIISTYRVLSKALLSGLAHLGLAGELAGEAQEAVGFGSGQGVPTARRRQEGGVGAACFDTPSWYELLVAGRKIAGSAQTRKHGAILQHGSILMRLDAARLYSLLAVPPQRRDRLARILADKATCLWAETGREVSWEEAAAAFARGFTDGLGLSLEEDDLTSAERRRAEELERDKYGHDAWTFRR